MFFRRQEKEQEEKEEGEEEEEEITASTWTNHCLNQKLLTRTGEVIYYFSITRYRSIIENTMNLSLKPVSQGNAVVNAPE